MTTSNPDKQELQSNYKNAVAKQAIEGLLDAAGFTPDDLQTALEAIKVAKELKQQPKSTEGYKHFLDKTPVYDDVDAFIFKRASSKAGRYYIRMYDSKSGKPIVKSLKTTDKTQAIVTARQVYIDYKGKIDRGERIKSIKTADLIEMYVKKLSNRVTPIPKQGITPDTFRLKKHYLNNWMEFIHHLGFENRKIDKIQPQECREFCEWMNNKPKHPTYSGNKSSPRCVEQVNNMASEVRLMYYKIAVKERYINESQVPQFDRLPNELDESYKRDIMSGEQYERYWKFLEYKYVTKKHNPMVDKKELIKRRIFKDFIGISYNLGTRPKELLGLKMKNIHIGEGWSKEKQEQYYIIEIPRENSKTGKSRRPVSPIKKRVDRIVACYKELGIDLQPNDYLFLNPNQVNLDGDRKSYGRMIYYQRLRQTLIRSGLWDELEKEGKRITLYSSRHSYACWRLRHGNVPIHLLAKQMGTSVSKIENTYGHIELEQELDTITQNQGFLKRAGISIETPQVVDTE